MYITNIIIMAKEVPYNENPKTTDDVVFTITTFLTDGTLADAYKINKIVIYFVERGYTAENLRKYAVEIDETTYTTYFKDSIPIFILGDTSYLSTDPANALITKINTDKDGNPLLGTYQFIWHTNGNAKEGDYFLCYNFNLLPAGETYYNNIQFRLLTDMAFVTSTPTYRSDEKDYENILDRYTCEFLKLRISSSDKTPQVINKFYGACAKQYRDLDDLVTQILDLSDANVTNPLLLPYLARTLGVDLQGDDVVLWRRQIKQAIPLFKKKGTRIGLEEALGSMGVTLKEVINLWQVRSKAIWQDGFIVTEDQTQFILTKLAILPIDTNNFAVSLRLVNTDYYIDLSPDYVTLTNNNGVTTATWVGNNLSVNPISLQEGDILRILYQYAPVTDQGVEDYIRSLELFDSRDETIPDLCPEKNWNTRVIGENDPYLGIICTSLYPAEKPIIWGKIRTEFPYSENVYNMEEYNGSTRDSENPCHIGCDFTDICSCCQSSKISLSVEINDIDSEKIADTYEMVNDFLPADAILQTLSYSAGRNEYIPTPEESIEYLIQISPEDYVVTGQMDFNRIIENASDLSAELDRSSLVSSTNIQFSGSGTGQNTAIVLFSPGYRFDTFGVDTNNDNLLEILSGPDTGEFTVALGDRYELTINQGSPDTINFPLNISSFPFRLSNVFVSDSGASIYQDNLFTFTDTIDFVNTPVQENWLIVVTSGPYIGTYTITEIISNNYSFILNTFPATVSVTGLSYDLRTPSNITVLSSTTGSVGITERGRLEGSLLTEEYGIKPGNFVEYLGNQYEISSIATRPTVPVNDMVYLKSYNLGTIVGTVSFRYLNRLIPLGIGYLAIKGMQLTGTTPVINNLVENNEFLENYLIVINSNYYKIEDITGSVMTLDGYPFISSWGLTGVSVNYEIMQLIKTSPITTQNNAEYYLLDRRGNERIDILTETSSYMPMMMSEYDNPEFGLDYVSLSNESIWIDINYEQSN